ncbi:MAG: hypothetical protein DRR19_32525 [Candidatus Parabeggiatoa sp. nov. 1]|nr:MAG: hypothetical protein DRR19_32525 [Gammaproteobacteria bacterium]
MKKVIYTVYFTLLASANVLSQADNPNEDPWKGKVKLGFAKMSGNVDTESLNYGLSLIHLIKDEHKKPKNMVSFNIKGNIGETGGEKYQDELTIRLFDGYRLAKASAVYGQMTYLENEFQGYEHQWKLGAGYIHYWLDEGNKNFSTRMGYQARFSEHTTGEDESQNFFLVGFRGGYPIMENISIRTELNHEANFTDLEDYETDFSLSLVFEVNKTINVEIDYNVEYDNMPVTGIEKTDNSFSTNLVYKF